MRASYRTRLTGVAFLLLAPTLASAQVGSQPDKSPYREISRSTFISASYAEVDGNGGDFGVGPHDGTLYGLTLNLRANRFIGLGIGLSAGDFQRRIIDPFVELENRDQGIVGQTLTLAEVQVTFNLTGGKTWHRLAPYLSLNGGLAFANETAADTSGYSFDTRFFLAPGAGIRVALGQRLHLKAEVKALSWKLSYPDSYRNEPPLDPGTPADPHAVITDGMISQWTRSGWFGVSLSWSP